MTKDIYKHNSPDVDTQDTQAVQVGLEFREAAELNAEIDCLLGFESQVMGGKSHRRISNIADDLQWEEAPDYVGHDTISLELLELRSVPLMVLESYEAPKRITKKSKPVIQKYIAVFDLEGVLHTTVPFESENRAVACALWYVLSK